MTEYPVKTDEDGQMAWDFVEGNKPVMEVDEYGNKRWLLNGKLHREDGPAIEWADGDKSWYLNDEFIVSTGPDIEKALFTLSTYLQDQEVTKDD